MRDADGLLACMTDRVDDDFLDRCPRLRVVSATLKGYDNFDVAACARHGVWLTALPHQLTAPTAELGIGLIIGLMRHVAAGDRHVRSGTFRGWRPELYGAGLAGATVGMIGMGAIGQALARRLRAFDAGVLYHDIQPLTPEREAELDVRQASLDELLAASHVVLPLLPLRDDTAGLLDRNALAQMRTGGVPGERQPWIPGRRGCRGRCARIGTARRLRGRRLRCGGLGPGQPPRRIDPTLLAHPHTLFTPHLGSGVDDVRRAMSHAAVDQIAQALAGGRPEYAVNELA